MAIIRVSSIKEINLPSASKIKGENGEVYQYNSLLYFKKVANERGDLSRSFNCERLKILEKLDLVEDKDINLVRRNIENLNTTDYIACLNLIKFKLERIDNKILEDVGDLRRALMISLNRSNS